MQCFNQNKLNIEFLINRIIQLSINNHHLLIFITIFVNNQYYITIIISILIITIAVCHQILDIHQITKKIKNNKKNKDDLLNYNQQHVQTLVEQYQKGYDINASFDEFNKQCNIFRIRLFSEFDIFMELLAQKLTEFYI